MKKKFLTLAAAAVLLSLVTVPALAEGDRGGPGWANLDPALTEGRDMGSWKTMSDWLGQEAQAWKAWIDEGAREQLTNGTGSFGHSFVKEEKAAETEKPQELSADTADEAKVPVVKRQVITTQLVEAENEAKARIQKQLAGIADEVKIQTGAGSVTNTVQDLAALVAQQRQQLFDAANEAKARVRQLPSKTMLSDALTLPHEEDEMILKNADRKPISAIYPSLRPDTDKGAEDLEKEWRLASPLTSSWGDSSYFDDRTRPWGSSPFGSSWSDRSYFDDDDLPWGSSFPRLGNLSGRLLPGARRFTVSDATKRRIGKVNVSSILPSGQSGTILSAPMNGVIMITANSPMYQAACQLGIPIVTTVDTDTANDGETPKLVGMGISDLLDFSGFPSNDAPLIRSTALGGPEYGG